MAKVLSSISGNLISAASAGYAPTNGADVSAIASAYQVVSATGTQLYASTAYVTSVNSAPLSASRAGNAANAVLATSAYYDGTGRLISSLPDSTTVSSIASGYAASAASSKQDSSAMSAYALSADVSGCIDTVSANSATWASASAISAYALSADVSSTIDTVSAQSANWGGSALALSAGPGVKLEKVGDTLVASTDETVLWSGSAVMSATVTLNLDDDVTKYRYIDIYSMPHYTNHIPEMMRVSTEYMSGNTDAKGSYTVIAHAGGGGMRFNNAYMRIINYTSIQLSERQQVSLIGSAISTGTPQNVIVKVVGVCKLPGA